MPEQPSPRNLVGPRVRTLRVQAGLSQETLAAKLQLAGWDLSRGGLSKVEARLRRVSDAELWILKGVLGCEIGDLFPGRVQKLELGQVLER
ncbi:helix-turn-helix domain-containing protein [Haloferula sp. A504]|uniref:helix-turn-helix domain-containing protein n=1 Tax=Haloferula sp. A504 TaxID=3373601 RepID=UPI0031BFFAB6|nr:helix-turn-helix domain-containing protein [Verrucomicrobiaceae bacterium E54]